MAFSICCTLHFNPERIIAVSVILSDIMYSNLYVEKAQTGSGAGAAGDLALEPEPEPDRGPPGDGGATSAGEQVLRQAGLDSFKIGLLRAEGLTALPGLRAATDQVLLEAGLSAPQAVAVGEALRAYEAAQTQRDTIQRYSARTLEEPGSGEEPLPQKEKKASAKLALVARLQAWSCSRGRKAWLLAGCPCIMLIAALLCALQLLGYTDAMPIFNVLWGVHIAPAQLPPLVPAPANGHPCSWEG